MDGLSIISITVIATVGVTITFALVDLVRHLLRLRQPERRPVEARWQRVDNLAKHPFAADEIEPPAAPPPGPAPAPRVHRQAEAAEATAAYAAQTWRSAPGGRIRPDLYIYESALPPKPPITSRMPHPHIQYWQYADPSNYQ